ncbi:HAMP domain-containing sensor histidine kinase [Corynebacterium renale]|uniref:Signal transduction histidine-protein kinase/phosphatase MprB n=1 Tax=Corynebacterium renale TaxID=1724 RepID=A0A2A9DKU6_9CORY|nr:HAMP domain-containing sensor histidine kinase [Corynebacterium renale]PFG26986.1 two-component system sensor histidine kinase MprB [Corynebacterium renale]SQI24486.1 Two component system sensor kinase protein [Corynebacterium renale]
MSLLYKLSSRSDEVGDEEITAPVRWRLSLITGVLVAIAVTAVTLVAYLTVAFSLNSAQDKDLARAVDSVMEFTDDADFVENLPAEVQRFKAYNPDTRIAITPPGWTLSVGDPIPTGADIMTPRDDDQITAHTVGSERIAGRTNMDGATVVMAKSLHSQHSALAALGLVLLAVSVLGVIVAVILGIVVSNVTVRPFSRLQRAIDNVTRTDLLRPIPVSGDDEVARLTRSFNAMMSALQESRVRQSALVADAGHELRTPLTSLRTNVELLLAVTSQVESPHFSNSDRRDLERDVVAQLDEFSTLIGDLVDLARSDDAESFDEVLELPEVVEVAVERVQRRRTDVTFDVQVEPWALIGSSFTLGRAIVNLLDNATKWSPENGVVTVRTHVVDPNTIELTIADQGPGIPESERGKVFERFYRAVTERSAPGSGLGLAIVRRAIVSHGGAVWADEAPGGGALMRVRLPGLMDESAVLAAQGRPELAGKSDGSPELLNAEDRTSLPEMLKRFRHAQEAYGKKISGPGGEDSPAPSDGRP